MKKKSYYNLRFFLLVCLFPVIFKTFGPTRLEKERKKEKDLGKALLTSL